MLDRRKIAATLLTVLLVVGLVTSLAPAAHAEEEGAVNPWSFEMAPYVWLPEVQGTIRVRNETADLNVTFNDVFDLLGAGKLFAAGGHAEVRYDRFSFFLDAFGGTVRPTASATVGGQIIQRRVTADVVTNWSFFEFGPAYRLLQWPMKQGERPISIDALVGGRLMYFYDSITLTGSGGRLNRFVSSSSTWVDPFVGGRFDVPVWGDLDVIFRGDIGGFGAGSDLAWNVLGGFQYILPWEPGGANTSLVAVWKTLSFDYESGNAVQSNLTFSGPAFGLMAHF